METVLDEFGRIVLPQQMREDLGLAPGTVLEIEEQAGGIFLKPVSEEPALALENGVLVFTGEPEGDLEEAVSRHREERIRMLVGTSRE